MTPVGRALEAPGADVRRHQAALDPLSASVMPPNEALPRSESDQEVTNGAGVTSPASRPPDAIPSPTVGPPIRMTGGAGCNRARLQPKSFDTED
jgi:hypothetical protein